SAPPPPPAFQADALVANAGPGTTLGQQPFSQSVTLDGTKSFYRVNDTTKRLPATAKWELVSAPASATITGLPSSTTSTSVSLPASPTIGTYTMKLTVTEGGLSASETVD